MPTTVLVAGSTGMMGTKIVRALLERGAAVRALVRPGKDKEAGELRGFGAAVVEGDLLDPASLPPACEGVEVIVSAAQGLRDVIVGGQTNLLRAAEKAGVGRMVPSDYSADFFKLTDGENRNLDLRREFDAVLDASAVRGTSVLNGAFTEMLLRGFGGDPKTGTFTYWGTGGEPCDYTTTDDTAAFTAAAALDADAPRVLRVAGDTVTPNQLHATLEEVSGKTLKKVRAGSIDDLAKKIDGEKAANPGKDGDTFPTWQQLQYLHNMVSGRAKLDPLDNDRYPGLRFESVKNFLRRAGDTKGQS